MSATDDATADLSTATISDALDRLGLPGSVHGLTPLRDGQRMRGRAYTVRYVPAGAVPGTVGDYLDDIEPGAVVVLDNQQRTDCTVWGDILTALAHDRGVAGTAISGVCRDTARAFELGYPIYSKGRFMRTGKDRVEVADVQTPVALGDVRVAPDDLVIGDDDGLVVIPGTEVDRVLEVAAEIHEREERILADGLELGSLREARARHGYHTLQRGGN